MKGSQLLFANKGVWIADELFSLREFNHLRAFVQVKLTDIVENAIAS